MKHRPLGRTGLYVTEICLGTATFGGQGWWKVWGEVDQASANQLVERALAAGVNFIDTADVYAEGHSERILGQALRDLKVKREDVDHRHQGARSSRARARTMSACRAVTS